MSACSHKCGGVCCRRFPLNMTPDRLGARYVELVAIRDAGGELERWARDLIMIAEMVIPLSEESDERPFYTCKHLDDATGLCTVYDQRPQMCSDYPNYGTPGRSCEWCGFSAIAAEPELVQLKAAP